MVKAKKTYKCMECASVFSKWSGQCPECEQWNSVEEISAEHSSKPNRFGYTGMLAEVRLMTEVELTQAPRLTTGMSEFDRVLGGGLVPGSVVLVGGDPGVGKSTGLLQVSCNLSVNQQVLYVTGEESPQQIATRAKRLGLAAHKLLLLAETQVEHICATAAREKVKIVVIDSIQTMQVMESQSAPGSVSQVRESAAMLTRFAKQSGIAFFLVGHVTKTGDLAGPRVLEHIIDVVCYIEGNSDSRFRIIRAIKNRYGAVNELGVFAMTEKGLTEIKNPSAIFLSRLDQAMAGSVIMVIWEGSRPLLVEIQALVDDSHGDNPRRVTVGLDQNRLAMLLAVLHRHGGIVTYNQDVFVNVVGGVRVMETGVDLALLMAVASSLSNKPLPNDLVVFGEVGLAGEIRPVSGGQERIREAVKHGFKRAVVPDANVPKNGIKGIEINGVKKISAALEVI